MLDLSSAEVTNLSVDTSEKHILAQLQDKSMSQACIAQMEDMTATALAGIKGHGCFSLLCQSGLNFCHSEILGYCNVCIHHLEEKYQKQKYKA